MQYLVVTADGHDYGRDADRAACIAAARRIGGKVEQLDESLCKTGIVIFDAQED